MNTTAHEVFRDEFRISTDPARLDIGVIHGFLTRSYWAAGIPVEIVERSIAGSLPFGIYHGNAQVGFARVITDYATFGYVADVFVLEEYRGRGLAKWLVATIMAHPDLQGLRRWMLATRDAHGLYARYGFVPLRGPDRWMELHRPEIYGPRDPGSRNER